MSALPPKADIGCLAELMIEHGVGVRLSRAIEFKQLDENFFDEED